MTGNSRQKPTEGPTATGKAVTLLRKGLYYLCLLLAAALGSYVIDYELSSPDIDLREQFEIAWHDGIEIKGPGGFLDATAKALNLLKRKDPENYRMVQNYLGKIECVRRGSGVYMWERPPRFVVGEKSVEEPARIYASSIVHDAYHSKLYNDALHNGHSRDEALGVSTGRKAELACIKVQSESLTRTTGFLPFRLLDRLLIFYSGRRRYEEIPYKDRWW